MSPRGGKREGAGRPSRGLPTTKVAVYYDDRDLINKYAKKLNIPVVELVHRVFNDEDIQTTLSKISKELKKQGWNIDNNQLEN